MLHDADEYDVEEDGANQSASGGMFVDETDTAFNAGYGNDRASIVHRQTVEVTGRGEREQRCEEEKYGTGGAAEDGTDREKKCGGDGGEKT